MKKLFEKYISMSSQKKKLIAYTGVACIIVLFGLFLYIQRPPEKKVKEEVKFEEVLPEVRVLEKTLYEQTTQRVEETQKKLKQIETEIKKLKAFVGANLKESSEKQKEIPDIFSEIQKIKKELDDIKKQKTEQQVNQYQRYRRFSGQKPTPKERRWIGEIGDIEDQETLSEKDKQTKKDSKDEQVEKEKNEVFLPPSWAKGDLLTGFAAFTSKHGEKEPLKVLIRLKDLAVLPNEIKSNLRGCYVIGEAKGNLADQRAHVRLLRLSCVSREGNSVIDEPVKGWVIDEDGRVGLRGKVVTKMGSFISRYLLAGFLEGFGSAYSRAQYTESIDGASILSSIKPNKAAEAGLGQGIANVGENLADFFLDLAKQTFPVIEVGTGKEITVVFEEGTMLKIKNTPIVGHNRHKKIGNISVLADYK